MKKLFLINDTLANKISYYHVMLMLAALPFDQFYSHIILISFGFHTLINIKIAYLEGLFQPKKNILTAFFFVTLFSALYSKYPGGAGIDISRQLFIFLFPVFFTLNALNYHKYRDNILLIFSLVITIVIIGLYGRVLYLIHYYHMPIRAITSDFFINHKFSAPINMHATFFSLQVAVAFFYALFKVFETKKLTIKICFGLISVILFAGLVQLGAKSILIAVLIGLNMAVPYFLIPTGKKLRYTLLMSVITVVVVRLAVTSSGLKERFVTDLKADLSEYTQTDESVEPRLVRWQAEMAVIGERPLIGYGAGSELPVLGNEYYNRKLYLSYINRLNAHSQYLTCMLTAGVVGLLVYLFTLYFGFYQALSQRDMLFFIFVLLITALSVSESFMNAEKGVYFYSLFFSFFVFSASAPSLK